MMDAHNLTSVGMYTMEQQGSTKHQPDQCHCSLLGIERLLTARTLNCPEQLEICNSSKVAQKRVPQVAQVLKAGRHLEAEGQHWQQICSMSSSFHQIDPQLYCTRIAVPGQSSILCS